jgi:hypothetical protein
MMGGKLKSIIMLCMLFVSFEGSAQIIRTLLGDGTLASGATDGNLGQSVYAKMTIPYGVAVDRNGNIYVSDNNYNTVRKIRPDGLIVPFAGTGALGYSGDGGAAISAKLNAPMGITCDTLGNVYIADAGNHVVRKVNGFGVISTYAGNHALLSSSGGGDGGMATDAPLGACSGLAFDGSGNLYIANGNDRVRKVTPAGIISTVAGGTIGYSGNGGQATAAAMEGVSDVYVDAAGILYISEQVNSVVRKVSTTGVISVFAGTGLSSGSTGDGLQATAAKLNVPGGIRKDAAGNMYICDIGNNRIRRVTPAGVISNYSGSSQGYAGDGGPATTTAVKYYFPTNIAIDAIGRIFITDKGPGFAGSGGGRRLRQIFKVDTVQLSASPGISLCSTDTVRFSVNTTNSYYSYVYNWRLNGALVGYAPTYRPTSIANGDRVTCTIVDTTHGLNLTLAVSDTLTLSIGTTVTPSVTTTTTGDTVCAGAHVTFGAVPVNGGSAPTYQWMVGSVASGTGSTFDYVPANGDTVRVVMTSNAPCATVTTVTSVYRVIRVNPLPVAGTISGAATMCPGDNITLSVSGSAGSGSWTASNASATISSSGVVHAVTAGVDTFTYTVTTATCGSATATKVVTINAAPVAGSVTGLNFVCPGSSVTLTTTGTGGSWSMSNARATITSSGVVSGVTAGADTAIYTVTNSCGTAIATFPLTVGVSSLHDAGTIVGSSTVCSGSTVSLSDTATGGVWYTSAPATASITATGVVSGLTPGTANIYYVVASGCSPDTAFHSITVILVLNAGTITGAGTACVGISVSLSDTTSGGVWSSSNNTIATVSASGAVSVLAPGTVTISYINGNSCGYDTATHDIVIAPQPFADTITGALLGCVGSLITLTDTASGGVWSSSAPAIASVSASGVVTALAAGTATISYSVTNSCGTAVATHGLSIGAFPVFTSSLTPPDVCSGTLFSYEPTSSTPGATFNWTRSVVTGILNPGATSAGNPNEILINTTTSPVDVVYIFAVASGGCSIIQNVTVTVNPIPTLSSPLAVNACSGRSFDYIPASATTGTTYIWTRAAVTGITPATGAGTGAIHEVLTNSTTLSLPVVYAFTLNYAGCTNPQNVTVTVEPQGPPPPAITTHSPSWMCKNTMFQNFGTSSVPDTNITYEWSATNASVWAQGNNHQYSIVNFTSPGLATVYLSSSVAGHSCSTRDSFTVYVDPATNEMPSIEYYDGNFMATNGMATYQWGYDDANTLDSTMLTGETSSSYGNTSPDFANKYYWVITEHLTCMQKTYYNVPAGVANVNSGIKEVNVYPNPTSGSCTVNIASSYTEPAVITVTDMVGKTVLTQKAITNDKTRLHINGAAGIYLVGVQTAHGKYVTRVTISQ